MPDPCRLWDYQTFSFLLSVLEVQQCNRHSFCRHPGSYPAAAIRSIPEPTCRHILQGDRHSHSQGRCLSFGLYFLVYLIKRTAHCNFLRKPSQRQILLSKKMGINYLHHWTQAPIQLWTRVGKLSSGKLYSIFSLGRQFLATIYQKTTARNIPIREIQETREPGSTRKRGKYTYSKSPFSPDTRRQTLQSQQIPINLLTHTAIIVNLCFILIDASNTAPTRDEEVLWKPYWSAFPF